MKVHKIMLIVFCLGILSKSNAQIATKKTNVIIILTDDQGYADLSCHGNPYIQTPTMDALYQESVSFSDFHVAPTCATTRAALMTGRYSGSVGTWMTYMGRHHLAKEEITMADVFQMKLPKGRFDLEASLFDADDHIFPVYYLYIEKI